MVRATVNKLFLFLLLLGLGITSKASHLVGGEISYKCLGSGQYEVTLTIFRDDFYANPAATLDNPAILTIFNRDNNSRLRTENMSLGSDVILPTNTNPCVSNPPNDVRIERGVYKKTISLPNNTNGYTLTYQRCCRNDAVGNILNLQGSTYTINVPANSVCNSSPVYVNQPPLFLCVNSKLEFDMSATDANGDGLRYSLCAPLQGLSSGNPTVDNFNQAEAPPYDSVKYYNAYNSQKPLGSTSTINIHPTTGQLTVVAKTQGLFVVGICVEEVRGGVVLSKSIRDFQFNVQDCQIASSVPIVATDNSNSSAIRINDSTFSNCQGALVKFDNDVNQTGNTYFWDFGVSNRTDDTAIIKNPTYSYADTGTYYATLIINKGRPCSDTSRIKVLYYPGLITNFTFTPRCQNELIQLNDSSYSPYNDVNKWQWILSRGDTSYVKDPTKLFTTPGTYSVQLTSGTVRGCVGKITKSIVVNPKPKADFTAGFLCYKNNATFTDASTVGSGTITKYSWNFGDGFTDTLKNATHTYNVFADSFSVRHIVTTALGCKDTIIKKIKMDDTVKIRYTTTPSSFCEKTPVTFTNTSTGGNPTAFQWIINNGTTVSGNTTTATFPNSGIFPVKLIATNRCGKDTLNSTISVTANPVINLGTDVTVCNKSTKTLNAVGAFDSLRWNTNQNTASITLDGSRSPVNITVYKNGCIGRDTVLVRKQTITPNFTNNYLCLNKPITFNNTSTVNTGTLVQYNWKYGDGNIDNNVQNPTHSFSPFANYTVQLIATSDIGCKDTFSKTILMDSVLNVDFKTAEIVSCQRKAIDFIDITKGGVNNQNIWRIENNNFVSKDKNYTFLGTGNYPVKLVVTNRCYADSITKNIQIRPRPNVYIGRDTILCKNQAAIFSVNPSLYDSIRWINGSNAASIIADGSINPIKIKVYAAQCLAEDTVNVVAPKFNLNFTNDFVCYNKPVTFNNTSSITPGTITNYNWNFGDGQTINGVKNPIHTYDIFGPKNVQLIATGNLGLCSDTINESLQMDDTILFVVNPVPSDICFGKSVAYTSSSFGGVNTNYIWNLNNTNPKTGSSATYTHTVEGANIIKLTANHRCGTDSIKYPFNVLALPKINLGDDNIIMCPGEIKFIKINVTSDSIFWSTGDKNIDSIGIDGSIPQINVDVYKNGCLSKDSIFVSSNCDIFIPTAFSPNNDGFNDYLNMMDKSIKSYTLKIYNRWNELVFETNDLDYSWDGTYKGQPCAVDNYSYVASGIKYSNEPFSIRGIISLIK